MSSNKKGGRLHSLCSSINMHNEKQCRVGGRSKLPFMVEAVGKKEIVMLPLNSHGRL